LTKKYYKRKTLFFLRLGGRVYGLKQVNNIIREQAQHCRKSQHSAFLTLLFSGCVSGISGAISFSFFEVSIVLYSQKILLRK